MNYRLLVNYIKQTHLFLQSSAVKSINSHITIRNWLIGFYIFEFEQKGKDRAKYGDKLLKKLSASLKITGLSETSLKYNRLFYISYPQIGQTLSDELRNNLKISQTLSDEFKKLPSIKKNDYYHYTTLLKQVSFSHFVELIKVDDSVKRNYYEFLILKTNLSVRELKRQISTLAYERTGLSRNKNNSINLIKSKLSPEIPTDAVKDIYFFEFLDIKNDYIVEESNLETALLNHLEKFMMELGNGFCFEARQKRVVVGDEYFFVDLVFYHRILKCHILVDLKIDSFSHTHAAQLNMYLNYFNKNVKEKTDNPPIGILLVTDKNKALVEYTTANMKNLMFVSKYMIHLPEKKKLEEFILNELKKL